MAMKTINVAALKASLSRCLRAAEHGEQLLVFDRSRPIAQIGPPPPTSKDPFARLAALQHSKQLGRLVRNRCGRHWRGNQNA